MCREWRTTGLTIFNEEGENLGSSKQAAVEGVSKVVLSRIAMASPSCGKCDEHHSEHGDVAAR